MRHIATIAFVFIAAGCADVLGVDFDRVRPEVGGAAGTESGGGGATSAGGGAGGRGGNEGGNGGTTNTGPLVTLVSEDMRATSLAVDATDVYFVVDNTSRSIDGLHRVAKDGSNHQRLSPRPGLNHVVVGANDIFFSSDSRLFKLSKSGGAETVLVALDSVSDIEGLFITDDALYWTERYGVNNNGRLSKIGLSDVDPTDLLETGSGTRPYGVAADASALYWTNFQSHNVMTAGLDGSAPMALATLLTEPAALAANATHLCWSELGALLAMPKAGGTPNRIPRSGIPRGVTAAPTHCYFAEDIGIVRAALDMSSAAPIVEMANTQDVAFDPSTGRVFFTAWGEAGAVFHAAP